MRSPTIIKNSNIKPSTESGGALVEFAIVALLLLLLVGGIIEFGLLYYNKQVITNASREGARAGAIFKISKDANGNPLLDEDDNPIKITVTESEIENIVTSYCANRLLSFGADNSLIVNATGVDTLNYPQDFTVEVKFTHTFLFSSLLKIFGADFGPDIEISSTTVMKME